ncbi:hypothetical protein PRIPAC_73491, partial [Pristionchus pacificus]
QTTTTPAGWTSTDRQGGFFNTTTLPGGQTTTTVKGQTTTTVPGQTTTTVKSQTTTTPAGWTSTDRQGGFYNTTTLPGGQTTTTAKGQTTTTVKDQTTTTVKGQTTTTPAGWTSTDRQGGFFNTTTIPGVTTAPCTGPSCPTTTEKPGCVGGYFPEPGAIVDGNFGKFVGIYTAVSACQEACTASVSYGLLPCLGVVYYRSTGVCNVMQYEVPHMSTTPGNSSDIVIFTKCGTSPCDGGFTKQPGTFDYSKDSGKFAGYFKDLWSCGETCTRLESYGLLPCLGFSYRTSDGRCLVLQYSLPTLIDGSTNGGEVLYTSCNNTFPPTTTSPPVGSTTTAAPVTTAPGCHSTYGPPITGVIPPRGNGTKFGGYFTTVDACKELCTNFYSYGLLPCYGFTYAPSVRGYCTVIQYPITVITTSPGSDTVLYTKCGPPTTVIGTTSTTPVTLSTIISTTAAPATTTTTRMAPPTMTTTTAATTTTTLRTTTTSTTTAAPVTTTTVTTTTSAAPMTTTTTVKRDDVCDKGFKLVDEHADMDSFGQGKFGGYFTYEDSCRELCATNYGLRACIGYGFEPDNRGKCTLFQYDISSHSSNADSTARLAVKC